MPTYYETLATKRYLPGDSFGQPVTIVIAVAEGSDLGHEGVDEIGQVLSVREKT